ncbi:transporter substrate-binding domain-containing protein [Endozoicomonas sp. SM1973]|uniref:Transporter substrate-binding domain-containing protein n=1 Tax=Spartinivicinus marinus TaxID=2994442 RepID=A0A853I785_9GAMM|nr:transporter substrate-binding domain-containing protein [Spartinivicinus marinus]MCX4029491.1 transporter substrate-binding domain-containing protein [Spartinivicinus marinus]NYZ65065.1 transporter substrate-binding domain-containing protein [Spartinivicinus marinus]
MELKQRLSFFVAITLCTCLANLAQAVAQELTLGISNSKLKPYRWVEKGIVKGANPDVVKEAAKRINIHIKILTMPWKRVLLLIKNGNLHGSIGGYKNTERLSFGIYTEVPLHYSYFSIFILNNTSFRFTTIKDLYGKRIGRLSGNHFSTEFDQAVVQGNIYLSEANKRHQLLTMLYTHRLDAVIDVNSPMKIALKEQNIDTIIDLPIPVSKPKASYLWFSKPAQIPPDIIKRFDQVLKKMLQDGTIEQITSRHGFEYNL